MGTPSFPMTLHSFFWLHGYFSDEYYKENYWQHHPGSYKYIITEFIRMVMGPLLLVCYLVYETGSHTVHIGLELFM